MARPSTAETIAARLDSGLTPPHATQRLATEPRDGSSSRRNSIARHRFCTPVVSPVPRSVRLDGR